MEEKQTSEDKISDEIPCKCGNENHKAGLIVGKFGRLTGSEQDKVKIQIFEGDEIKSVIVDKNKLLERLK